MHTAANASAESASGIPGNDDLTVAVPGRPQKPKPGTHKPSGNQNQGGGNGNGGPGSGPKPPSSDPRPDDPLKPVEDTVTHTMDPVVVATNRCNEALAAADIPATPARLRQCIAAYREGGMSAVNTLVSGLLDTLGGFLGSGGDNGGTS